MLFESPIDFSQYGQTSFIKQFIPPEAPHWVVDVGAHDGVHGSNSRAFVLEGWTALLIEPLPAVFEALRRNSPDRSNIILEQCACSEFEGTAQFHVGTDGPSGQSSSLCEDDVWKSNHSGEEITVRVRTLTNLLNDHQCPSDFAVLLVDAEGMDLEVLKSLAFNQFRPAVICTEIYLLNPAKNEQKAELLKRNGYRLRGALGSDRIWTLSDLKSSGSSARLYSGEYLPKQIAELPVKKGVAFFDHVSLTDGILTVSGWAMAPDQSVPGVVLLGVRTEDGVLWQQSARHPRSDVEANFQKSSLLYSGVVASFPFSAVQSEVTVMVLQWQDESRWENQAIVKPAIATL